MTMQPMPDLELELKKIIKSGHVPAVGYAFVEAKGDKVETTSAAIGNKSTEPTDPTHPTVDPDTRFPASSLSKIVFTYLVLQLVKNERITLDEPLHDILPNKRFLVGSDYPDKAKELTARHVLSHTTGLPNWGQDLSSTLLFDPASELGTGYSYSGESFLYLQQVIEATMGESLETLAQEHVFKPLGMKRSTFLPQSEDDTNIVEVHNQLEKPVPLYEVKPPINSAASLLTTADDFSKFMSAWLKDMDDPDDLITRQAFEPTSADDFMACGLGWHIYRNKEEVIAYQYGANPNTGSFIAINVKDRKGAVFFTNSENGMSIANQIMSSSDLAPIGNMQALFEYKRYSQSNEPRRWSQTDEPGWQETINGLIAEDQGRFDDAREHFENAFRLSGEDKFNKRCLDWFNEVHPTSPEKKAFTTPLETFVGEYNNQYQKAEISISDSGLIFSELGHETKLVRVSETEFFPEKDQYFKISFVGGQMRYDSIDGWNKLLTKESQELEQSLPPTSLTSIECASLVAESEDPALPLNSSVKSIPDPKTVDLAEWVRELEHCTTAKPITYTISMDAFDAAQLKHIEESIGKILELKGYIFKITPSADITDARALAEAPPMTELTGPPSDKPSSTDEETAGNACQH